MTTRATTKDTQDPLLDPILFARGMAVIRIFFGIILFANGLAKLEPSLGRIDLGPYHANLITRDGARGILNFEVNERRIREGAPQGTQVPGLKPFVNDVVLANWGIFQWLVVLIELGAGGLLMLGLATRLGALVGLGQQLFLALVYVSSNRWLFEQPHEYVPLIVLAIVPAGRLWGLDARLVRDTPAFRRWPF
ncbi:MAG: DoxX family membrane protein [Chloroflexia bacterium]|nr:DoxX family membrane protein [Chloroflexia bacterium]